MRTSGIVTYNPDEMDAIRAALDADKAACPECQRGTPVPHAAYTYIANGRAVSHQCRSGCRAFDPEAGTMMGRAHCTCDSCW